ncbi:MAG: preprotein translocase subunit SecY, partial [Planctomycetota bacterium]
MFQAVQNLFQIPELRKRILFTFGLLILYRIGWNIPIPGIHPGYVRAVVGSGNRQPGLMDFL